MADAVEVADELLTEVVDAADDKDRRKYPTVLVAIPGWPSQDPGRKMIYYVRPTPQKAARMLKRVKKQLPQFEWSVEHLTAPEARKLRLAPFVVRGSLAVPVEVSPTTRGWRLKDAVDGS